MKSFKQKGASLIIVIILLLMLTILALTQSSFNSLLTRMATNASDQVIAFQTAEGALNQGVTALMAGTYTPTNFLSNSNGLYLYNPSNTNLWSTVNWSSSSVIQSYQGNSTSRGAYFIEQLPSVITAGKSMQKPSAMYRITSRAVGATANTLVILQATVEIPQY